MIGHDEERGDELRAIEFERIKGGKPFDITADWFGELLERHRPARADRRRPALSPAARSADPGQRRPRTRLGDTAQAGRHPGPTPVAAPVT